MTFWWGLPYDPTDGWIRQTGRKVPRERLGCLTLKTLRVGVVESGVLPKNRGVAIRWVGSTGV